MVLTPWTIPSIKGKGPSPRAAHTCNLVDDKLFLFGGWNGFEALKDFYILYINPNFKWQKLLESENRPLQRNNHASAVYSNSLIIHGGHDGNKWLKDMYEFTIKKSFNYEDYDEINEELIGEWKKFRVKSKSRKPSSRACHTINRLYGKLYLFGGYDGNKCYNDLWVYDICKMTWEEIEFNNYIPRCRSGHCSISCNKGIIFFGGHTGKEYISDVSLYNPDKNEFITPKLFGICPSARKGHSLALVDDVSIVMFGGYDGKNRSNDLYILDIFDLPNSIRWEKRIEDNSPTARQRNSMTMFSLGKCLVFGGYDGNCWKSDVYILDIKQFSDSNYNKNLSLPMLSNLDSLVDNPDFSDVIFLLDNNEKLYAHKCILVAQSEYFKSMFRIGMSESNSNQISLVNISKRDFKVLIRFLYTSYIDETDFQVLCNVMLLADLYNLNALSNICIKRIKQMVEVGNVCQLLKIAHCTNIDNLVFFCIEFASNHVDSIINSEDFKSLSDEFPQLALKISNSAINRLI